MSSNTIAEKPNHSAPRLLHVLLAISGTLALLDVAGDWPMRIVMALILICSSLPLALVISVFAGLLAVLPPLFPVAPLEMLPILTLLCMVFFSRGQRFHWQSISQGAANTNTGLLLLALTVAITTALFEPYDWRCLLLAAVLVLWVLRGTPASLCHWLAPANLVLLAFSAALALFTLEIGGRQITPWQGLYGYCEPDAEVLFTLRPDIDIVAGVERYAGVRTPIRISTSSQGLRDRYYPAKTADEIRVAIVGDSYTFGWAVDLPASIPKQVEHILRDRVKGRRVSVISCGLGGYAPWQELAMFRERVLPLEPDIVLFQSFVMNDVGESLLQDGGVLQAYSMSNMHALRRMALDRHPVGRIELWLERHSGLYRTLRYELQQQLLVAKVYNACRLLPDIPLLPYPPSAERPWWMEVHLAHWYPELEHAWDLFQRDVLRLRDLCADSGIPFLACNIPHPYLPEELEGILLESPPGLYERDKALHLVHDFFDENDIPQCDLVPVVRGYRSPEALYYPADGHFTPAGNRIIAEALAAFLMDRAIVPMIPQPSGLKLLH